MSHTWFPLSGAAAFVMRLPKRQSAILEIVGREGALMAPLPILAGELPPLDVHVVWIVPGQALRLQVDRVLAQPEVVRRLAAFGNLLVAELLREVLCIGHHALDARAARWLLEFQERSGQTFQATHDVLADVLAVARPTATKILHEFAKAGWITYQRGRLEVIDAEALQRACCSCHQEGEAMRRAHARRLDEIVANPARPSGTNQQAASATH
jgi:hypothetical protein